jgi:hypothetical protein
MSRLAAVHTGQPTQGLGTVPAAKPALKPAPTRQYASPLEAQKAEAEAAEASEVAKVLRAELEPEPAVVNPRNPYSTLAAANVAAALALSATELEVRQYFRKLPVSSGLEMLAKMRHQCDLAAETLQGRMDESNQERCTGCGKTLEESRKSQWIMQGSEVDPETGVPMPYRFCGPMCVRERNREKMLPPEERNKLRFDGREMGEVL